MVAPIQEAAPAHQSQEKPEVEATFLHNDVFKQIKDKYLRDSQQYISGEFNRSQESHSLFGRGNETGIMSMSQVSQGMIHNSETRLGILKTSIEDHFPDIDMNQPCSNVRDILRKYQGGSTGQGMGSLPNSWIDEMEVIEKQKPAEVYAHQ